MTFDLVDQLMVVVLAVLAIPYVCLALRGITLDDVREQIRQERRFHSRRDKEGVKE